MAKLGQYRQTSSERKKYHIDYSEWLEDGETIISYVVERKKLPAETATVEVTVTATIEGNTIEYFFSGGTDGSLYRLEFTTTTSSGQIKEDYVLYKIVDP